MNLTPHAQTGVALSYEALRPEYEKLWLAIQVSGGLTRPNATHEEVEAIIAPAAKARFQAVEQRTGVPWFVTGIVLTREAGSPPNFHAWLHNGDLMFDHEGKPRRTVHEPPGRPLNPACAWEDGAVDAYQLEGLSRTVPVDPIHRFPPYCDPTWSPAFVAWLLEKFNGWGYRLYHNIRSPYVWGATVVQQRGKYDRDSHFDPTVMDTQIGGMALLAALMQIDPTVKFEALAIA